MTQFTQFQRDQAELLGINLDEEVGRVQNGRRPNRNFFGRLWHYDETAVRNVQSQITEEVITEVLGKLSNVISREASRASAQLSDFFSILSTLYTNLELAESRDQTLWAVNEVEASIKHLLGITEDGAQAPQAENIARIQRLFAKPSAGRTAEDKPIAEAEITALIGKMRTFYDLLLEYKSIIEGKRGATKAELFNLRRHLLLALRRKQEGDLVPEKMEESKTRLEVTAESFLELDGEKRPQVAKALATNPDAEAGVVRAEVDLPALNGKGVLDAIHAAKALREGCLIEALDTLGETAIASVARKASEAFSCAFGWKSGGCFTDDELDTPPIQFTKMEVVDKRGDERVVETEFIHRSAKSARLSIGRIADIFTGFVSRGEKEGLYEIWGNALLAYFNHMQKNLEAIKGMPDQNMRGLDATLEHVNESRLALQQMLAITEPSKEVVQGTFTKVGNLMNQHPLLVLHIAEFDPGFQLGGDGGSEAESDLLELVGKRVSEANPVVATTTRTELEEKEEFGRLIDQTGHMGHLYSIYATVSYLMGGDKAQRMQFQEIYESINKVGLSPDQIRAKFIEQLSTKVLFADNSLWSISKWAIWLLLKPIVWILGLGMNQFVSGVKEYMQGFDEEMKVGTSTEKSDLVLGRLFGASKSISAVCKDAELQERQDGPEGVFREGLLEDRSRLSGNSTDEVYAQLTEKLIDQFFTKSTAISETFDSLDRSIADGIARVNFAFIRSLLAAASMAVRIPIWAVNTLVIKPIEWTVHWISQKVLKKGLVYMEVVKSAVDTTKAALKPETENMTQVTPIIDKSVLELLHTLWSALHTSDDGTEITSDQIDFDQYQVSDARKQKLTNALSALFQAVDDVEGLETNKHGKKKAPIVGDFTDYFAEKGKEIGLNATADVAVAAMHTLTRPDVVYRLLNNGMGAVIESMTANETELAVKSDGQDRKDIHKMVKQLVSLSTHRARKVLSKPEEASDEEIHVHIGKMKRTFLASEEAPEFVEATRQVDRDRKLKDTEYKEMIAKWEQIIQTYCASGEQSVDIGELIEVREELFSIWRTLQEDLVYLDNDRRTRTASLNIHKRQLHKIIQALTSFQETYLTMLDGAVRQNFRAHHGAEIRELDQATAYCIEIEGLLSQCSESLAASKGDPKKVDTLGEIDSELVARCESKIKLADSIYAKLRQALPEQGETTISDDLRRVISSSQTQLDYLKALSERLKRHARLAKYSKEVIGEATTGVPSQTPLRTQVIVDKVSMRSVARRLRANLIEQFPEYQIPTTQDHEVVEKINSALKILEVSDTQEDQAKQIQIIENLLHAACSMRATTLSEHLQQGIAISRQRGKTGKKELESMNELDVLSEAGGLAKRRAELLEKTKSALSDIKIATTNLEDVVAVQWNLDTDLSSVPLMRGLLQTANTELENLILSLYTRGAGKPEIAEFMILRLGAIPMIKA